MVVVGIEYTLVCEGNYTYMVDSIMLDQPTKPSELEKRMKVQWTLVRGVECDIMDFTIVRITDAMQ